MSDDVTLPDPTDQVPIFRINSLGERREKPSTFARNKGEAKRLVKRLAAVTGHSYVYPR